MLGTIKTKAFTKALKTKSRIKKFLRDEEGSLSDMTWVIGAAVVVVLIIVVFMLLAPDTAENIWDKFVNYATGEFGI